MMELHERYRQDAAFRQLVDMMEALLSRGDFTPSEVRLAALLACTNMAYRRVRTVPLTLDRGFADQDLRHGLMRSISELDDEIREMSRRRLE